MRRPLRLLAALLLQLLTLQGVFLGGRSTCALQPVLASAAPEAEHHGAQHHAADAAVQQDGAPHHGAPDGEHASSHCALAAGCGAAALGGRTVVAPASVVIAAGPTYAGDFDAPRSLGTAPETPPPRG
jgi:hypothetical protein